MEKPSIINYDSVRNCAKPKLTFQQNLFHASPLRCAIPFSMLKLLFALAKAQADALRDLLQQRCLVAAILPADIENLVGDFLCFPACLHRVK